MYQVTTLQAFVAEWLCGHSCRGGPTLTHLGSFVAFALRICTCAMCFAARTLNPFSRKKICAHKRPADASTAYQLRQVSLAKVAGPKRPQQQRCEKDRGRQGQHIQEQTHGTDSLQF
jgi:hypothetical protein